MFKKLIFAAFCLLSALGNPIETANDAPLTMHFDEAIINHCSDNYNVSHNNHTRENDLVFCSFRNDKPLWRPWRPLLDYASIVDFSENPVDWSDTDAVTGVKDQGQCGSCWSFSVTGAMEGFVSVTYGEPAPELSEQQLVDCDRTDFGCHGGEMDHALRWIENNGGICSEGEYPYHAERGDCTPCTAVEGTDIQSIMDIHPAEDDLMAAVQKQPVSVAIEADKPSFQLYSGGVYDGNCGTNLDHGVLLVGYGHDEALGLDYWKIKNSWGGEWGEKGYMRMIRGDASSGGQCGILLSAVIPI